MPQSIMIGLLVLGGVLLLVAITGGQFKIFVAEVDTPVSNTPVRLISGLLGLIFITAALVLNKTAPAAPTPAPTGSPTSTSSSPTPGSSSAATTASVSGAAVTPSIPPVAQSAAANPDPRPVTSKSEYAVVFDPPTNIRSAPSTTSNTLCSVTSKTAIRILGSEGSWYRTDVCGDGGVGYIYRNQVKF